MTKPVLKTRRLHLLPYCEDDFGMLLELHADPEVNRFLASGPVPLGPEEVRRRLARYMAHNRTDRLSGWKLETLAGEPVGRAGFSRLDTPEGHELGYVVKRAAWGRGYATEIAIALVAWFFEQSDEPHLFACVEQGHDASFKVLQRAGLRFWQDREIDGVACRVYRITRDMFLRQSSEANTG